jgi:hypothetical protein
MAKVISALLFLVTIPACSDSGIALSDLPAAATDILCTYAARCGEMPDVDSCKAAGGTDMGQLLADVKAGKTKYDGKAAAACLDAMSSMSCNYSDPVNDGEQACKDTFKGTVAAGGDCFINEECISMQCELTGTCTIGVACCAGTCTAGPVGIGSGCSWGGPVCVDTAYCPSELVATCMARAAVGQSCDTSSPEDSCVAGAYCVANGSNTGTCGKLPAEGQSCYPTGASYWPACDSMLDYCDNVTLKCVPKVAVGSVCSVSVSCVDYAACDATGRCAALAGAGEVCDDLTEPRCLGSLLCSSGTCALPPATAVCP